MQWFAIGKNHCALTGVSDSGTASNGMRRNLGDPARSPGKEYLLTSRKGEAAEMPGRESDMLIVVLKQGNACGAKGHALVCRGLRRH